MVDCLFANSLIDGFLGSNLTGQAIVWAQILGSVVMLACAIGKWRQLKAQTMTMRRVGRDVMGGRDALEYYLARRPTQHCAIENIYNAACERLLKVLAPEARSRVLGREPNADAVLTAHEMELVRVQCEHVLDVEEIGVERGMGLISTVVMLSPMLGLLGTVWGVLDAFAEMGGKGATSTVSINAIAPAISAALVTTVVGLLVAIPGQIMHKSLSAAISRLEADMEGFVDTLIGRIALDFQGRDLT